MKTSQIPMRLKSLMQRAEMTMDQLAKSMGYKGASSIQRYLTEGEYKKDTINPDFAKRLEKALSGKGAPVISKSEIWELTGISGGLIDSFDPDDADTSSPDDWNETGVGVIDGRLSYKPEVSGGMPEISASAGMGLGRIEDDRPARLVTNGIASGHVVMGEWLIPPDYIRNALGAAPSQVVVMPVIGASMAPMLESNDRVLVDISQNVWVGDAVYIIDDGDSVLRAKTVRKVTASDPPAFKIISEAAPHDIETLTADRFRIVGRVVGRFSKL
ncbi:LexA family transcriptional regulator [Pseudohoeflea coraliihabitans]|uniref:LexA family transcriptional regulator n=1 Tax=Pseudohoeflea coraliihabitans TaxID=2860393 RepID=A0ABS6WMG3_9HYPH|nr:S24 family peptidase [Pseudohoeflea sp. DP4N28-3]MBW3096843.1 LexA family transcriptional regulator [Pseudohoeflea sp. DP4N28-3]